MPSKNLGQFLLAARKAKGISQTKVATALGYKSAQFISNAERGVCFPAKNKLTELAEVLGLEPEALKAEYMKEKSAELV